METKLPELASGFLGAVFSVLFGWIHKRQTDAKAEHEAMKEKTQILEKMVVKQVSVCHERSKVLGSHTERISDMQKNISCIKASVARIEGRLTKDD